MKISGFTFIRNAVIYDYPIIESIKSILPIVDEYVVAVGNSDDDTLDLIKSIQSDKIRIVQTIWDDSLREGGRVLAMETNKAMRAISPDSDWAFYLQADEVVHEKYLDVIYDAMLKNKPDDRVEGLLFNYLHFYGSYDYVGASRRWYRREIRIIRNNPQIQSYKDAQGFRINGRKLRVKLINAYIYHYGWVKHPARQQAKQMNFNKYWHNDEWVKNNIPKVDEFDYSNIDSLKKFISTHPKVMRPRIKAMNWNFSFNPNTKLKKNSLKNMILHWIEDRFKYRIGEYRNYHLLR